MARPFSAGTRAVTKLILLFGLIFLSGCAAKEVDTRRYLWPIGGNSPKIEFIRAIGSDRDVREGGESRVLEAILGIEEPQPIFGSPYDVAVDSRGRVYVSDLAKRDVLILDLPAHQVRHFERPKRDELYFEAPMALAVGREDLIYVSDNQQGRIYLFGADARLQKVIGQNRLVRPVGLACDRERDRLYVADAGSHQVMIFSGDGQWLKTFGQRGTATGEFNYPLDLEVDGDGNLYVLDTMNARVQVFDPEGKFLRGFGERGTSLGSFQMAKGIAVDRSGHVYVTDGIGHRFVIFDRQGTHLMTLGGRTSTEGKVGLPGGFDMPKGIDVDGGDGIWVVDSFNRMVHKYQFLNETYLREHPILPAQVYVPEALR
jgi:DNA-binding beta-propeller fold protein YncE